jgi:hypothetical protein
MMIGTTKSMPKILRQLLLLFCIVSCTAACKQHDHNHADPKGTIRFTNASVNTFEVYVNNEYVHEVASLSFYEAQLDAGVYTLRAQQPNSSPPVIKETTTALAKGGFYEFIFP